MAQQLNPFTEDLATGPVKGRLAKIFFQEIMRKLGVALASNQRVAATLAPYIGDLPPALVALGGDFGAALIQSPVGVARWLTKLTGGDVVKTHEFLNDGLDGLVSSFSSHIQTKQRKDQKYVPTDDDYQVVVAQYMAGLGQDKLGILKPLQQLVVIDVREKVFHDLLCPICLKGTARKGGKGPDAATVKRTYTDGCSEVPIVWALQNDYVPTNGSCCGNSTANTYLAAARANLQPSIPAATSTPAATAVLPKFTLTTAIQIVTGEHPKIQEVQLWARELTAGQEDGIAQDRRAIRRIQRLRNRT